MDDLTATDLPGAGDDLWNTGIAHVFRSGSSADSGSGDSQDQPRPKYCGRYRLNEEIARGGIGIVYRALDETLEREVAVKLLRNRYAKNNGMMERFLVEAQICAYLQHPGIVPVYEMGITEDQLPFFSMKLIEGRTLAELMEERGDKDLARARFITIIENICQTLAYAHSRRIIHRDLKPGNVMVGPFGEVQVLDWGFAKSLDKAEAEPELDRNPDRSPRTGVSSIAGSVLGTPAYMSPEQARGEVGALDERCDVFALGAILAEILTGRRSSARRDEEPLEDSVERINAERHRRLMDCDGDAELVDIARACLSTDRADRPATATVVADTIALYRANMERRTRDAQLMAAEARGRAEEERKAHRLAMAVSYLVLVAVILGAGVIWGLDSVRRQGQLRHDRTVKAAVAEAYAHLAREDWTKAEYALSKAREHVTRDSAREVAAEFTKAESTYAEARSLAVTAAVARERNATLLLRFRKIIGLPLAHPSADEAYVAAFAELGFDANAEALSASFLELGASEPLRTLVTHALEDWVLRIASADPERSAALERALPHLDADPVRVALRRAGADALVRSATGHDPTDAAPLTTLSLARRLVATGQHDRAAEILKDAALASPRDLLIHDAAVSLFCGGFAEDGWAFRPSHPGVALDEAIRHALAAAALSDDVFTRVRLTALIATAKKRAHVPPTAAKKKR
ncbi:MAG: serine/threonine-protein kinase [Planctomycetota bacterium]|nr:serine/threonine-protein kinase [Planctomycetota bacterium]